MDNAEKSKANLSLAAGAVLTALIRRTAPQTDYIVLDADGLAKLVHGDENAVADDHLLDAVEELEGKDLITLHPFDGDAQMIVINVPMDADEGDCSWRSAMRVAEIVSGVEMMAHFADDLGPDAVLLGVYVLAEGAGRSAPVSVPTRPTGNRLGLKQERFIRAKRRLTNDGLAFKLIPAYRSAGRPDAIELGRNIIANMLTADEIREIDAGGVK